MSYLSYIWTVVVVGLAPCLAQAQGGGNPFETLESGPAEAETVTECPRHWDRSTTLGGGPTLAPLGRIRGLRFVGDDRHNLVDHALLELTLRHWFGVPPPEKGGAANAPNWSIFGVEIAAGEIGGLIYGDWAADAGYFVRGSLLFRAGPRCGSNYQLRVGAERTIYETQPGRPKTTDRYDAHFHHQVIPAFRWYGGVSAFHIQLEDGNGATGDALSATLADPLWLSGAGVDLRFISSGDEENDEDWGVHLIGDVFSTALLPMKQSADLMAWHGMVTYRQSLENTLPGSGIVGDLIRANPDVQPAANARLSVDGALEYSAVSASVYRTAATERIDSVSPVVHVGYRSFPALTLGASIGAAFDADRREAFQLGAFATLQRPADASGGENPIGAGLRVRIGVLVPVAVSENDDEPKNLRNEGEEGAIPPTRITYSHNLPVPMVSVTASPISFLDVSLRGRLQHFIEDKWDVARNRWVATGEVTDAFLVGPALRVYFWIPRLPYAEVEYTEGLANLGGGRSQGFTISAGVNTSFGVGEP